jgi:hypothetical protein
MTATWPARADRPLVDVLRTLPDVSRRSLNVADARLLFERAELHGVAGVVHDGWCAARGGLEDSLERTLEMRRVARELDHGAHLAILGQVDRALERAGLRAVLLKGPLFAERFYARPSARATSDIDLLVDEARLEDATRALAEASYSPSRDASEARFRREHHHLHFEHAHALPLELHFHAYKGFGSVLYGEPLIARSRPASEASLRSLSVLAPEDEVIYLAVHAAAHRFVRLGWLYDLKLLVESMSDDELETARERSRGWGYSRAVAFTGELLEGVLGVFRARQLGHLAPVRSSLVHGVAPEPASALMRSATRFVYTTSLCDSAGRAARHAASTAIGRAKYAFGVGS